MLIYHRQERENLSANPNGYKVETREREREREPAHTLHYMLKGQQTDSKGTPKDKVPA